MVLSVLIGVGIGVGIGFVVFGGAKTDSCIVSVPTTNDEFTLLEWGALVGEGNALASSLDRGTEQMQARNIEDNIKKLSQLPRMAGTDQNNQVAEEIYQQWMALEFDRVEQIKYQVLLQYPNATNPNQFQVVNGNGDVVFDAPTAKLEPSLTDDERQPGIVRPFNSYSGIGNVKGPLVFINYGKLEDYDTLTSMNISVSGCVCIARYGISFRGSQAKLAEQNGCLGLVLYTDPSTFGPKEGYPAYPEGMSLPLSGVQRGSVQTANGDPLTPLRPSIRECVCACTVKLA
jgi:N-acetylated-alpha-linked acidic dipeptidase